MKIAIYIILLVSLMAGCNTTKSIPKVNQLLIFPVFSDIRVIKKAEKLEKDTGFTNMVKEEIAIQAKNSLPENVTSILLETNKIQLAEIYKAFEHIIEVSEKQASKTKIVTIPEILLQLLDSTNQDFGIGIFAKGFVRTEENLIKQYTLGRGIDFFSLGVIDIVPNKSFSTIVAFIIDKKNKKIRFYKKSKWKNRNPTESMVIKSQLYHVLMSYFQYEK